MPARSSSMDFSLLSSIHHNNSTTMNGLKPQNQGECVWACREKEYDLTGHSVVVSTIPSWMRYRISEPCGWTAELNVASLPTRQWFISDSTCPPKPSLPFTDVSTDSNSILLAGNLSSAQNHTKLSMAGNTCVNEGSDLRRAGLVSYLRWSKSWEGAFSQDQWTRTGMIIILWSGSRCSRFRLLITAENDLFCWSWSSMRYTRFFKRSTSYSMSLDAKGSYIVRRAPHSVYAHNFTTYSKTLLFTFNTGLN